MAGKGLTIPLSLDPREWVRGIKVVERSLESMEDELDEVERAGDKLERALEDNFKDAARDAERAGRDMNDGLERGLDADSGNLKTAAGSLAGEVVDEFVENWGEAVRSGDYAGAVRETLSQLGQIGGAIGGPAGAAIGGAAALALTVGFDKFMDTEGKARVKETTDSLFSDVEGAELSGAEAGAAFARGYVEAVSIPGQVQAALGLDSAAEAGAAVMRIAQETGLAYETVQQVIIGNEDALAEVEGQQAAVTEEANRAYKEHLRMKGVNVELSGQEFEKYQLLSDQAEAMGGILGTGGRVNTQNVENLRVQRLSTRAIANARLEALGVRDVLGQWKEPNFGPLAGQLATGARSAEDIVYWLTQASQIDVRVSGLTGSGGTTV